MPGLGGRYLPSGHLVYAAKRDPAKDEYALWAVAFDPQRGESRGTPVPVVDGERERTLTCRVALRLLKGPVAFPEQDNDAVVPAYAHHNVALAIAVKITRRRYGRL